MEELPKALFITGTDTGVGKTVVTAALASLLEKKGLKVGVIKPFQTGTELEGLGDAEFIYGFLEKDYDLSEVSPCRFRAPLSPYRAAMLEGAAVPLQYVLNHVGDYISRHDITLVEGAGGICVPVTSDYMMADLAFDLNASLIIVARPGLGTLNHTALSIQYAERKDVRVLGIVINGFPESPDIASKTNPAVLREVFSANLLGVLPFLSGIEVESGAFSGLREGVENYFCPLFGGSFCVENFLEKFS